MSDGSKQPGGEAILHGLGDVAAAEAFVAEAVSGEGAAALSDQFAVFIKWLDGDPLLPERDYSLRFRSSQALARITDLSYRSEPGSDDQLAAKTLAAGELGYCKIALKEAVQAAPFGENPAAGAFLVEDKASGRVLGAGTIEFALRRATNIAWHEMRIDKSVRAKANGQRPCVLWFTGLSGAGKSTIADRLEQQLFADGKRTYLLDGDNVRHGLNKDLGFTDQDRVENIRRVAEVARLMADAGLIVLVSFISPFRSERQMARALMEEGEFFEIFVDTPLDVCEARDPKGLYKKARKGELKNFTGIDSDYERPKKAELTLDASAKSAQELAHQVVDYLQARDVL